ncbi:MAG: M3 family oligoendopeptidase [Saprospirales bacterium]|jgi:M3 family oligoendopeptidase|nr:M3 family oligoendopeptidase [Saprospirales bacterium]
MTATLASTDTFESFPYTRPNLAAFTQAFEEQLGLFEAATSAAAQVDYLGELNRMREAFATMYNLCFIRHTVDTADPFYEQENTYFDENLPAYEALNDRFYRVLLGSPFQADLEKRYGSHLFVLAELALKTFRPEIQKDLQEENALSTEYTKLKAKSQIEFDGKSYNLSSFTPVEQSDDRSVRRRAATAKWALYEKNAASVEPLFDQMVRSRHRMARALGYDNFVAVGYARMRRSDYTPQMVANFRKQVRERIVPLTLELYERQRRRLGLDRLKYYDEDYKFPSGNPKPIGTPDAIVEHASRMYSELSPETDLFFRRLLDARLMDLVNHDGKATGGYCTYMPLFQAPFIFSNFNGTSGDIDVLTHEAGHAFQVWNSRHFEFDEYHWPTSDAAEIHSMSMEFFTWPWMHLFFGADTSKYQFMHLSNALLFLPYGVAVDEFQHIIYENPDMTPAERNAAWRGLEKIYLPHRDYSGNTFLENGGFWQKQNHIFNSPFYYIDYTLAQICAFQFWKKDIEDHKAAWGDYLRLCKAGGSQSFLDLVRLANLRSPFEDGCVDSVVGEIRSYLDNVDDSNF